MNHANAAATFGLMSLIILITMFTLFTMWIFSIVELAKNEYRGDNTRLIWLLVVLLTGPLGVILYFLIGRGQKIENKIYKLDELKNSITERDRKTKYDIN